MCLSRGGGGGGGVFFRFDTDVAVREKIRWKDELERKELIRKSH